MGHIPNLRMFKVKFLGPTNHKGARVTITEPAARELTFKHRIVLSYSYSLGDVLEQAVQHLQDIGMNVTCTGSMGDEYCIMCDNFAEDWVELKK